MKIRAAVIGLGQIGQGYDYTEPLVGPSKILTHAAGFFNHPNFDLVGGVDINKKACVAFEHKFGVRTFDTIAQLFNSTNPDVVAIATPTRLHFDHFNEVLQFQPKGILLEKPVSAEYNLSKIILDKAKRNDVHLMVNYIRRYDPSIQTLRKEKISNNIGDIQKANVWYPGEFSHNAIHYIDLIHYLFSESTEELNMVYASKDTANFDFILSNKNLTIHFLNSPRKNLLISEMDIITSSGRILYKSDGGELYFYSKIPDSTFKNFDRFHDNSTNYTTDFNRYQIHVVDAFYKRLKKVNEIHYEDIFAEKIFAQHRSLREVLNA